MDQQQQQQQQQQFCLRWNNHQNTLISVFDSLLESGSLTDCALAAEGQCMNAHKVVLSACSPYFAVRFRPLYFYFIRWPCVPSYVWLPDHRKFSTFLRLPRCVITTFHMFALRFSTAFSLFGERTRHLLITLKRTAHALDFSL